MDETRIPAAIWEGSFHLLGVEVKCVQLDNGQRIIEAESFHALMRAMHEAPSDVELGDIEAFRRWHRGQTYIDVKP